MKKRIRNYKELLLFLFSLICSIGLVTGCGRKEIVFETQDSAQTEQGIQQMEQTDAQTPDDETKALQAAKTTDSVPETLPEEGVQNTEAEGTDRSSECYVDVGGAVVTPGVYKVYEGTRIYEVILLAGGLSQDAEVNCINQALPVYDGMKLIIPTQAEWEAGEFKLDENEMVVSADKTQISQQEEADGLIDINEATVEELCTLPGVGSTKAESIVAYREENGKFSSIEDIKKVAGIKEGLFEKIKSKIKV